MVFASLMNLRYCWLFSRGSLAAASSTLVEANNIGQPSCYPYFRYREKMSGGLAAEYRFSMALFITLLNNYLNVPIPNLAVKKYRAIRLHMVSRSMRLVPVKGVAITGRQDERMQVT